MWRDDPRLPGTKGIIMSSLGTSRVNMRRSAAKSRGTWLERHAVLKPTGPVRYGSGSNRCPTSLPYTRCLKMDD
jgi:hypothetical protein